MDKDELKRRTKQFGLRIITLVNALPNTIAGRAIGAQLARCGTSVGANYRAACRGRSTAEFIAKIGNVEEEADESAWWLEIVIEGEFLPPSHVESLLKEAEELTAIFTAIGRTSKRNHPRKRAT
ncbi:MAG: four helix bundle protein [Lentisphaeria bacterium]|nr:four helix bundle protein [Lentisphaeria bacterium]